MDAGTATIIGGRLPADEIGRRVGEPDLLVRDTRPSLNAAWSYRPIDVKHHLTLNDDEDAAALCSAPATPGLAQAEPVPGVAGRKHKGDLLQLAHYQRMLEASGWAADEGRWGGIIGKEELVVWWNLDEKIWRTPAVTKKSRMRSTMAVYDFEFAFRLDIMAAARLHAQDDTHQLIVVPISNGECSDCPWREHCAGLLAADSGDISLLPRLGWTQWKMHRDVTGATRRSQLAGLDWRTAHILGAGVDVAALRDLTDPMEDAEPLTAVVANKRKAACLAEMGLITVGDLASLCPTTALYSGYRTGKMDRHIDEARAALDPSPAFRLRDVDRIEVPRADVEIDIDMENVDEGAYLWGALLTDRSNTGLFPPGYRSLRLLGSLGRRLRGKLRWILGLARGATPPGRRPRTDPQGLLLQRRRRERPNATSSRGSSRRGRCLHRRSGVGRPTAGRPRPSHHRRFPLVEEDCPARRICLDGRGPGRD